MKQKGRLTYIGDEEKKKLDEFTNKQKKAINNLTLKTVLIIALNRLYEDSKKQGFKKIYLEYLTEQIEQDNTQQEQ